MSSRKEIAKALGSVRLPQPKKLGYEFFEHLAETDFRRAKEALLNSNLGKHEQKIILKRLRKVNPNPK